jgi:hypothetical protein
MGKPLDSGTFSGPHPTTREFYDQLLAWGFTVRREENRHIVMRCPGGGTIRVLRSLAGRADAALIEKAARLVGTTLEGFWAGPPEPTTENEPQTTNSTPPSRRRKGEAHDSAISVVLSAHVKARRPLGFEEVVELCGGRVTRDQVRTASSALCRDGNLTRVRAGVYQWADPTTKPATDSAGIPPQLVIHHAAPGPPTTDREPAQTVPADAVDLFRQLFPRGVTMTAETYADFQRWAELTQKLNDQSRAS